MSVSWISDFTRAVARLSEGFCPMCDGELTRTEAAPFAEARLSFQTDGVVFDDEPGTREVEHPGFCSPCDVGWALQTIAGRPALVPSRPLTVPEVRRLFDRLGKSPS